MVRKLVLDKLAEKRLSMKDASLAMGHAHSYLYQFLKRGIPLQLHERDRAHLSSMLGVPEYELRGSSLPLPRRQYIKTSLDISEDRIAILGEPQLKVATGAGPPSIVSGAQLVGAVADLPVFGTAQGGSGALILSNQAVDYVSRPGPLMKVRDGYGMIVTGDSMDPAHKSGSIALVNPHLPPRSGDTCIFRRHDDHGEVLAVIKELRRFTDDAWFVRQYNPRKDFALKRSEWQVCHVTVGNYFAR